MMMNAVRDIPVGKIDLATAGDGAECARIYEPIVRGTAISFELTPPTADAMRERIIRTLTRLPWLVYRLQDRVAGYAYACAFRSREAYRWTVEVAVYVDADHRRRGVASSLYAALVAGLRFMRYRSAVAVITLPNDPSEQLHRRWGFRRVGVIESAGYKLGKWHDTAWWQLDLGDSPTPAEPFALAQIRQTTEWDKLLANLQPMS